MSDIYTVEIDGIEYDLEGDHPPTEAEARAAIGQPASQPARMQSPAGADRQTDPSWQAKLESKIEQRYPGILSEPVMDDGGGIAMMPMGKVWGAAKATPGVLAKGVEMGRRGLGISKARAATNMSEALEAAKDVPLHLDSVRPLVNRAIELGKRGNRRGLATIRDLTKQVSDPAATMLPQEAQDFVSSLSRMSANEWGNLSGPMKRQVTQIGQALRGALTDAAETVGKGSQYTSGVKEYARAATAAKAAKAGAAVAGTAATGYLGLGWLRHILSQLP